MTQETLIDKELTNLSQEPGSSDDFQRHGSIRKVLHSLVGNDSLLGKSAKMLDRPKTKFDDDTYPEYFKEYTIINEYNALRDHLIPGLYVIPSANSCHIWYGVIFVRNGFYKGGVFRFTLEIPEDFPHSHPPKVTMDPELFHPAVDSRSHEMNISNAFPSWSQSNRLWQVVDHIHSLLVRINVKHPFNQEAATLFESNQEEFIQKARECSEKSALLAVQTVYQESDAHFIRFSKFDESVHAIAKTTFLASKVNRPSKDQLQRDGRPLGLSWVQFGTLKPCSRYQKPP